MNSELIAQFLGLLLISALCSGSEIGLYSLNRVRLRYQMQQGTRRARVLGWLVTPPGATITALLILNNIVNLGLTATAEDLFDHNSAWSVVFTTLLVTPIVLIFGEFLPKHLFRRHADHLMFDLSFLLATGRILLAPLAWIADGLAGVLQRVLGAPRTGIWEPHTSRDNLRTFLHAEGSGHDLTPVQKQLIDRIMALERLDCTYTKVVKPLSQVSSLDSGATVGAAMKGLQSPYFARYLVTDHKSGNPTGYLSAVTLLTAEDTVRIGDLVRPLPILPQATSLAVALQRLHQQGADLALITGNDGKAQSVLFRTDCLRVLARL